MLTAHGHPADTVSGLETNTFWDGLFHALAWACTGAGLGMLWVTTPLHRRGWGWALLGLLLAGWGLFNLVEGIVDHHILTIHHVRDDVENPFPWDLGLLVLSAGVLTVGTILARWGIRLDRRSSA